MPLTTTTQRSRLDASNQNQPKVQTAIDECVRQRLANCPYAYYFNRITWRLEDDRLRLNGCLPTFYMKQVLQTMLRDIDNVKQIVNDVDVVSTTGLSSTRPR